LDNQFPPGWFDIEPKKYADLGAMLYLSALTKTHNRRMLFQAVYTYETPLRLGQYYIFRQNGFPRGFVTFAGLSTEAEMKYAIEGKPLADKDFASGSSFWIVDMVAPFGQLRHIVDTLKREIPHSRVRTNRMDSDMSRERIVEWTRNENGGVHMRLYRKKAFKRLLKREAAHNGLDSPSRRG
jgi:cytolysin-activating lysine-acyltransferase